MVQLLVWYGMVWYGMYGMVWYGMVKNWLLLSVLLWSYGCMREVWRATLAS